MKRTNQFLNHFEEYLGFVSLVFTSLLIFVQVVLRYVFNYSLSWSEEAARFLIVWFIFIGSSIAVREKAHATVDALVVILPARWKGSFSILANLISISFCVVLIWSSCVMISNVIAFGSVTPAIGMPMYIPYLAVPVGTALMLIRFVQLLVTDIKNIRSSKGPVNDLSDKEAANL
ncbi:TRAP transporter small permease [Peribacillus deserti]|uniref:TRAP transporter small permease n=1 Tax=Peribacillus deserti TaxID=673318 RepID=A0A2N5M4V3_9BACI|nr:TRAP transporter small permease [Peribacillus deserti]PLT29394.1 TRAP transporter small permease [Peribacillus deserti]